MSSSEPEEENADLDVPETRETISSKCGLIFPVGRIKTRLKDLNIASGVGLGAAIVATTVTEGIIAEILDIALESAKRKKTKRINPKDIRYALESDPELKELTEHAEFWDSNLMLHSRKSEIEHKVKEIRDQRTKAKKRRMTNAQNRSRKKQKIALNEKKKEKKKAAKKKKELPKKKKEVPKKKKKKKSKKRRTQLSSPELSPAKRNSDKEEEDNSSSKLNFDDSSDET